MSRLLGEADTKKLMKWLVRRIVSRWMGEGNGQFVLSKVNSSGNSLVAFYRQLPMGRKYTSFGLKYQKLLVGWNLIKYEEMFAETLIYIRYVVITIVIFTSMIDIELFYLTQLLSFIACFFE